MTNVEDSGEVSMAAPFPLGSDSAGKADHGPHNQGGGVQQSQSFYKAVRFCHSVIRSLRDILVHGVG